MASIVAVAATDEMSQVAALNQLRAAHSRALERLHRERLERGQPTEAAYEWVEQLEAAIMRLGRQK
jgi:hypothetical protein